MDVRHDQNSTASGRVIIESIVEAMTAGLEDLYTRTVAPELFQVYLHASDFQRLEGILGEMQAEAATALDQRVDSLNRAREGGLRRVVRRLRNVVNLVFGPILRLCRVGLPSGEVGARLIAKPRNGWQITFNRNEDPEAAPGDIVIDAVLMLPPKIELGAGMSTRSVRTIIRSTPTSERTGRRPRVDKMAATLILEPAKPAPEREHPGASISRPGGAGPGRIDPTGRPMLRFRDRDGTKSYRMTKSSIVIGRGGTGVWTDITLAAGPDVSREHLRIREDGGRFFLKDLSTLGTSIDGISVPGSLVRSGNRFVDQDIWVPLPCPSRISLAGAIELEFGREENAS